MYQLRLIKTQLRLALLSNRAFCLKKSIILIMQDINQRINSPEFKLSQKIFARRINLNISRKQAAKLTNLDLDAYTTIEQGILFNNLNLYKQVLAKLESVK